MKEVLMKFFSGKLGWFTGWRPVVLSVYHQIVWLCVLAAEEEICDPHQETLPKATDFHMDEVVYFEINYGQRQYTSQEKSVLCFKASNN